MTEQTKTTEPTFVLTRSIHAPQETVWASLLQMVEGAGQGGGYHREGDPAPLGVGSVLLLDLAGSQMREVVTDYDAPNLRRYAIVAGAPVDGYEATIELSTAEAGTDVVWSVWGTAHNDAGREFMSFAEKFLSGAIDMLDQLSTDAG